MRNLRSDTIAVPDIRWSCIELRMYFCDEIFGLSSYSKLYVCIGSGNGHIYHSIQAVHPI